MGHKATNIQPGWAWVKTLCACTSHCGCCTYSHHELFNCTDTFWSYCHSWNNGGIASCISWEHQFTKCVPPCIFSMLTASWQAWNRCRDLQPRAESSLIYCIQWWIACCPHLAPQWGVNICKMTHSFCWSYIYISGYTTKSKTKQKTPTWRISPWFKQTESFQIFIIKIFCHVVPALGATASSNSSDCRTVWKNSKALGNSWVKAFVHLAQVAQGLLISWASDSNFSNLELSGTEMGNFNTQNMFSNAELWLHLSDCKRNKQTRILKQLGERPDKSLHCPFKRRWAWNPLGFLEMEFHS